MDLTTWIAPLCAFLLECGLVVTAAVLSRRAKPVSILLGVATFVGPAWIAGPVPLLRAIVALLGGIGLLRVIDTVRTPEPWSVQRRIVHVMSFVDSRTVRPAPRRLELRALLRAAFWATVAVLAFRVVDSARTLVAWSSGLVIAYAIIEAGYALVGVAYRLAGFVTPPLHVSPFASLTIAELWGKRWARPINVWLYDTCFRPLARRGHPMLGLFWGFVVSAVGHGYPIVVAVDLATAAMMTAYFLVQGIFVLVERRIGVARWPRPARRAWTITIMLTSSPLFVVPALRLLGY